MNLPSLDQLAIAETITLLKATERYVLPKIAFDKEKRAYTLAIVRAVCRLKESTSFVRAKNMQSSISAKEINSLSSRRVTLSNPNKYYKLALFHIEDAYRSIDTRFFTGCSDHIFWWR